MVHVFSFYAGGYETNISHCKTATGYILAFQTDLRICDFVKKGCVVMGLGCRFKTSLFSQRTAVCLADCLTNR